MKTITPRTEFKKYDVPCGYRKAAKVWKAVNQLIAKKLLEGEEVKLPSRMGSLVIYGKKTPLLAEGAHRRRNINWPATNKLWAECPECKERRQFVVYLNEHSDRVYYKFNWNKTYMYVANRHLYKFVPTKDNRAALSELIIAGKEYQNNVWT